MDMKVYGNCIDQCMNLVFCLLVVLQSVHCAVIMYYKTALKDLCWKIELDLLFLTT